MSGRQIYMHSLQGVEINKSQNDPSLQPEIITHKKAVFERIIAAGIVFGGSELVGWLKKAGWEPKADRTVKRFWEYATHLKKIRRDLFTEKITLAMMNSGNLLDLSQWYRFYEDFVPIQFTKSDLAIGWALNEIQKLDQFEADDLDVLGPEFEGGQDG